MYVCICKAVTDKQIREAVDQGVSTLGGLRVRLGVARHCGTCATTAEQLIEESLERCSGQLAAAPA